MTGIHEHNDSSRTPDRKHELRLCLPSRPPMLNCRLPNPVAPRRFGECVDLGRMPPQKIVSSEGETMTQTPKTSGDLAPRTRPRTRLRIRPRGLAFAPAFSVLLGGSVYLVR